MTKDKILNTLITLEFASINNFYSRKAKNISGTLVQPTRNFKSLKNAEYIKPIPFNEWDTPQNKRQQQFWQITHKGAKKIGRIGEYKNKETKSVANVHHESMVRDVCMSFLTLYPDWDIDFKFNHEIKKVYPDIYIQMNTPDMKKQYRFYIECERKKNPARTFRETIKKYEKINFSKNDKTKILIIWSNVNWNVLARPLEYGLEINQSKKIFFDGQYHSLLKLLKSLPVHRYRLMPFYDFDKLHLPVWHTPQGNKVKLINN